MDQEKYEISKEGLAKALAELLSCTVVAQYMAHGYHWNVKGPEFTQFHELFSDIYEDWTGPEDRYAEYIRTLGFDAPFSLQDFLALSCIEARPSAGDPIEMTAILYQANAQLLLCVYDVFEIANALNSQGIANFAAERIDAHQKWNWQLGTIVGADATTIQTLNVEAGKSEAESPLEATDVVVEIQPMQASAREITFSKAAETELSAIVNQHNKSVDGDRKIGLSTLRAVYRRGSGDMERVAAFTNLVKAGTPKNRAYVQDNDLLPKTHKLSTVTALTASIAAESELTATLQSESDYATPEDALLAITEYAGLGYEVKPAFRAAWKRGVVAGGSGFDRAADLAMDLYNSIDADLLPKQEKE